MAMRYAVLFPGQGSQAVGMGADVFAAHPERLVDVADGVLGWSLSDLCRNGPIEKLTATRYAQPALFAVAYELWAALRHRVKTLPVAAAGHSLGEYTALASAGAFTFEEGLRLVDQRAQAMAEAVEKAESGMVAVLGIKDQAAERIAADRRAAGGRLWVANLNAPGQVVMAGAAEDVDWLLANARTLGLRRAVRLEVAGAFHTPMMDSARVRFEPVLSQVEMRATAWPVWGNVTARPVESVDVRRVLSRQITAPVRFGPTLRGMADEGINSFVHIGPGAVTAGLAKRAARGCVVYVVSTLAEAETVAAAING